MYKINLILSFSMNVIVSFLVLYIQMASDDFRYSLKIMTPLIALLVFWWQI